MQAIVSDRYGTPDVMALRQVEKPVPADHEVLVKVVATSLNALDWHLLLGEPFFMRFTFGMFRPKITILGADMAGIVESVGKEVKRFKPGDAVFGDMVERGIGGLAEYVTVPENLLVAKPVNLTFQETSTIPVAATTALQGLRDMGGLQPGMKVLINGASGGVGTWAVQIAKALGAEVTAVCSTSKMDQARMLGADRVIDYTQEDFTRNGQQYDLILAANGNRTLGEYEQALTPTGTFVMAGGSYSQMFQTILFGRFKTKAGGNTFQFVSAKSNTADLAFLVELIETGQIKPVIDRCYPLAETPEAMRYLLDGHARGKIVIVVDPEAAA